MQASNTIERPVKSMTKIEWTTSDCIAVGDGLVSISPDLKAGWRLKNNFRILAFLAQAGMALQEAA